MERMHVSESLHRPTVRHVSTGPFDRSPQRAVAVICAGREVGTCASVLRAFAITVALTVVWLQSMLAAALVDPLFPKLRPRDPWIASLIVEGTHRSTTFRDLVKRLDTRDAIVYIESRTDLRKALGGVTRLMSAAAGYRYVSISIRSGYSEDVAIAILAHELQHALEIAKAREIVDAESLAAFYERIGERKCFDAAVGCYETKEARRVGDVVLGELRGSRAPENELTSRGAYSERMAKQPTLKDAIDRHSSLEGRTARERGHQEASRADEEGGR